MFTEVLKIKPQVDQASLATMSKQLSSRFQTVAKRFGEGFKTILKGNLLFLSAGFLASLLNPLDKIEAKIKAMLAKATDVRDLADRFQTDPATLFRLQAVGKSLGVTPDQLNDMMTKYADAIEKAREEIADPTKPLSESSVAVKQFVGEKDLGQSFFQFLTSLHARSGANQPGQDVFFSEGEQRKAHLREQNHELLPADERADLLRRGLLKVRTPQEVRDETERAVFGAPVRGAERRLIDADFPTELGRVGLRTGPAGVPSPASSRLPSALRPSESDVIPIKIGKNGKPMLVVEIDSPHFIPDKAVDPIAATIDKLGKLEDSRRAQETRNESKDFVTAGALINPNVVKGIEDAAQRERERENRQLSDAEALQNAARNIELLKNLMEDLSREATKWLANLSSFLPQVIQGIKDGWHWFQDNFAQLRQNSETVNDTVSGITNSRVWRALSGGGSGGSKP